MDLHKFAQEVHEVAVEHGWWVPEPDKETMFALIHSEWSEAFEAYRNNMKIYALDEDGEPYGVAVELIDGCLRILDYLAANGSTLIEADKDMRGLKASAITLPALVNRLHILTVNAGDCEDLSYGRRLFFGCIFRDVFKWLKSRDIIPEEVMHAKHKYNKTRPYRHGGMRC